LSVRKPTIAETFEQHYRVDSATGCFVWLRALKGPTSDRNNYGHLRVDGKPVAAHRFAYARRHGKIPAGKEVLHKCNNPQCVNWRHLLLGTMRENQAQKARELRAGKKLTPTKVRRIRAALARGTAQRTLAKRFGVCQMNISYIARGLIWQHA
jgi:hypothetical protein